MMSLYGRAQDSIWNVIDAFGLDENMTAPKWDKRMPDGSLQPVPLFDALMSVVELIIEESEARGADAAVARISRYLKAIAAQDASEPGGTR